MSKVYRWLFRLEIILVSLVLFFSLALLLADEVFPRFGIHFDVSSTGESMEPTILDGALVIWRDDVDYEDLAVGDIIFFRKRTDADIISSGAQRSNLIKEGETSEPQQKPTSEPQQEPASEPQAVYGKIRI